MPLENPKKNLRNIKRLVKSVNQNSKEIPKLTDTEIEEIKKLYGETPTGIYQEIEPQVLEVSKLYAKFFVERYESAEMAKVKNGKKVTNLRKFNSDGSLTKKGKEDQFRMGLTQKAFEIFLQQMLIPYHTTEATIDWREKFAENYKVPWDFYIPFFGTIDIKSTIDQNINVNCRDLESEKPDWIVGYKIFDINQPKWLKLLGYMDAEKVRQYPSEQAQRPYYKIPIADFEQEQYNSNRLKIHLYTVRKDIKNLETQKGK
jgi:hypothetical protein